jgi:Photosynthesis system II assembly factor YCF48
MPELSNLLRQRLAAGQTKGFLVHPDADTLTAYAEQSLPASERQNVVLHLAQCEPCREVVALSQAVVPEIATQTVVKPAPVSGWRRLLSPAFGLTAAVAAMAVIAVMVLQLPQKAGQTAPATEQAKVKSAADQVTPTQADSRPPAALPERSSRSAAAPQTEAKERDLLGRAESPSIAAVTALPAPPPAKLSANATAFTASVQKKDYLNTNFFDANSNETGGYASTVEGQNNNDFPAAPQPQAGASKNAFSSNNGFSANGLSANNGSITIFSDIPQNANGKSNLRILTPAPPSQPFGYKFRTMAEATVRALGLHPTRPAPAIRVGNLGNSTMGSSGMFASTLEKSQPAEVPATAEKAESGLARTDAFTPNALSGRLRSEAPPAIWKVAGGKLLKAAGTSQWEDAYPSTNDSIEFSFVTARGNDVWAGGSHAALVHSRDGGTTWEIVRLGKAATGNIVAIIAGASTVLVKTSDSQTWSSTDGGDTWTLRNE